MAMSKQKGTSKITVHVKVLVCSGKIKKTSSNMNCFATTAKIQCPQLQRDETRKTNHKTDLCDFRAHHARPHNTNITKSAIPDLTWNGIPHPHILLISFHQIFIFFGLYLTICNKSVIAKMSFKIGLTILYYRIFSSGDYFYLQIKSFVFS